MIKNRLFGLITLVSFVLFNCSEDTNMQAPDLKASGKMHPADAITLAEGQDVIDFEGLAKGTIVFEVFSHHGAGPIAVWGTNPAFPGENAAMIFDSSNPSPGDRDLGTPNEDFGGPGIGDGGKAGSPYENNTALGNVLIITEDFNPSVPNDADRKGASFTLNFSTLGTVTIYSMYFMDVEQEENAITVEFYDDGDALIGAAFVLPKNGDNGQHNFMFDDGVSGVMKMVVNIHGSGSIDNIVFSTEDVPPPPGEGCVFTQGYWKTHTKYGAPRRDDTWDKIGANGEDTEFFMSGKTYLEVMNTAPQGNAYYILGRQYIAAKLNVLSGADAPDNVANAISNSETLFSTYTPAQIGALKGSDALRQQFIMYAETLDQFNNSGTCE